MSKWFMSWLLRSPFHSLISGSILLITYKGRRSGKEYSAPLNYFRDGDTLWVSSVRKRTWWRNFREKWPIRILLQRVEFEGRGEAITEPETLRQAFIDFFRLAPENARLFKVRLKDDGTPDDEDLDRIVAELILVRIQI
jgi:endonuclease YncB( thermonuclease family)